MEPASEALLKQLLDNPAFIAWARDERPDENQIWEEWAGNNEEKRKAVSKARQLVKSVLSADKKLTDQHIDFKIRQALRRAKQIEIGGNANVRVLFRFFTWNAAATIVIAFGVAFAVFRIYKNNSQVPAAGSVISIAGSSRAITIENQDRAFKYVQLPDGSSVVLHKNSGITFPEQFDSLRREVELTGEAFFEVTKNPEQPFFVYANELVAKVHGTSFSIKAGEKEEHILVAVKTGKVSVFTRSDVNADEYKTDKEQAGLLLTPNQQATFERNQARLIRSTLNSAILLNIPIEHQPFIFSETPVLEVFDALEKAYGIDIEYNKDVMSQCSITATLDDEPLENKLKWICTILEATYQVSDQTITIKGNPCR
ncbi:FecR family protein [Dyadobacter sp. CY323]|uniref:FecR family protein n=1 Tax=Dyadobacter sp. CY323 TaxID=2907302 RepID=UPI001F2E5870|nr:FecR family protein [Dyadobacter sp. CY323]MCE6989330.1 FecR family protein [Dyadobacter sp. CY323]